jgi:hypothetical protein
VLLVKNSKKLNKKRKENKKKKKKKKGRGGCGATPTSTWVAAQPTLTTSVVQLDWGGCEGIPPLRVATLIFFYLFIIFNFLNNKFVFTSTKVLTIVLSYYS